jgi:hypothetical protein
MKLERGQGRIGSPVIELARWLFKRLQPSPARPAQMAVLERISLAPRQSLTLVEVQECKFLIVTSVEGISVVHPLGTGRIISLRHSLRRFPRLSPSSDVWRFWGNWQLAFSLGLRLRLPTK